MAVTRPPALSTDKPVSPLARLHRERTVIMGELAVLNVSAARLRHAENAEAAVHLEFADLSSSEIDAVANWARSPIGEPPPPDQKLRRALAEKLAAAESAAAAAKGAAQDIRQHTAELNQRLIAINVEIEVAVLDAVELEFADVCRQNTDVVDLLQIDGADHRWFEDRAAPCTLLGFIDDATSRLMELRFVPSESTFAYFETLKGYLQRHGKPVAFYSDKHSIFRVSREDAASGDGMTQFGRALSELNIEILCANTSQAKGRVERAHHTLQDRLVKELRLAGISTMEAANAFLPAFVQTYNDRFAKPPASERDLHRPIAGTNDLDDILCWREQRSVSRQLVINYNRMKFMLRPDKTSAALAGKVVDIYDFPDGRLEIRWKGLPLSYSVFDHLQRVSHAAIIEK